MPAAVETVFDVAAWFMDHALNDNEYLQPMKMHRLLYLSQAYFGLAYQGRKLAPATFVVDELGPIEPHVFRAFEQGRPSFYLNTALPKPVETFLESIWKKFGTFSADRLGELTQKSMAFQKAKAKGKREEIPFSDMMESFRKKKGQADVNEVVKPRVLKSHKGRPVKVSNWASGLRKVKEATPLQSQLKKQKKTPD